jgi:hypothetical protein
MQIASKRLAHAVFETFQLKVMRDWNLTALDVEVAFENEAVCFLR